MHAFILTSYCDPDVIRHVLQMFSACGPCYLHIDKASGLESELDSFRSLPNVTAESYYKTNWGSIYHLKALLRGASIMMQNPEVTHFHLMSAQDCPTVSMEDFKSYFKGNNRIYLQNLITADYPELILRYEHFHFFHLINYHDKSEKTQNLIGHIDRIQNTLHIKRKLYLPRKGMVYSSIPRDAMEFALAQTKLLHQLRYTYIPEEFFFQNAFFGTPFEKRVTGNDIRFTVWDDDARDKPAFLNINDLPAIDADDNVFCRKVKDPELLSFLENRWYGNDLYAPHKLPVSS